MADVIAGSNGTFPNAFWLVLEGFNIDMFNRLGIGTPALSGPFANLQGISIPLDSSGVEFEVSANTRVPQRIRFPFDIRFSNATSAICRFI